MSNEIKITIDESSIKPAVEEILRTLLKTYIRLQRHFDCIESHIEKVIIEIVVEHSDKIRAAVEKQITEILTPEKLQPFILGNLSRLINPPPSDDDYA